MRKFPFVILPYCVCVLLGILLIVEWSREKTEPIRERQTPPPAESDAGRLASKDVSDLRDDTEESPVSPPESDAGRFASKDVSDLRDDTGESPESPPERESLEIDLNRLKTLSKQDDPEALELLAEELTKRYATDKTALVRVHMAIGRAWNWVQGYPQSRAAYLRAERLIEEIRVGYVVLEMQRLVDLGECKMKLKDFQGARKLFDLAARFPIEEKPFWESDQSDRLIILHRTAVVQLVGLTPMDELHKVFYLPIARREIERTHPKKADKLYTADDAETARIKSHVIAVLEMFVRETPPEKPLRKHALGLLEFTRSGEF